MPEEKKTAKQAKESPMEVSRPKNRTWVGHEQEQGKITEAFLKRVSNLLEKAGEHLSQREKQYIKNTLSRDEYNRNFALSIGSMTMQDLIHRERERQTGVKTERQKGEIPISLIHGKTRTPDAIEVSVPKELLQAMRALPRPFTTLAYRVDGNNRIVFELFPRAPFQPTVSVTERDVQKDGTGYAIVIPSDARKSIGIESDTLLHLKLSSQRDYFVLEKVEIADQELAQILAGNLRKEDDKQKSRSHTFTWRGTQERDELGVGLTDLVRTGGYSLEVRLPKEVVKALQITGDMSLYFRFDESRIIFEKTPNELQEREVKVNRRGSGSTLGFRIPKDVQEHMGIDEETLLHFKLGGTSYFALEKVEDKALVQVLRDKD